MSKEKIVQLQDKDGNIVYPILKHNDYTDEDKQEVDKIKNKIDKSGDSMTGDLKIKDLSVYDSIAGTISAKEDTGVTTNDYNRQVNSSVDSQAVGPTSQVNASSESTTKGIQSQINTSHQSEANSSRSQINSSFNSVIDGDSAINTQINASSNTNINNSRRSQINASYDSSISSNDEDIISEANIISASSEIKIDDSRRCNSQSSYLSSINNNSYNASLLSAYDSNMSNSAYGSIISSARCKNNGKYSSMISSADSRFKEDDPSNTHQSLVVDRSTIISSRMCQIEGRSSTIISSDGGAASSNYGNCITKEWNSMILASRNVINPDRFTICGGLGGTVKDEETGEGSGSTENRKWEINSEYGTIKATGSITGNSSFADFAEYMESSSGEQIPTGVIVALDKGQKIRVAQEGDNPVGVISGTAGIILNAQGFEWKDRYLYDRYGQPIYVKKYMTYIKEELTEEEIENEIKPEIIGYKLYSEGEEIPEVGDTIDGKEIVKVEGIETQQLNPDWDEKAEYIPREDRDEWNVVGMKGQIYVNIDDTVEEHGYITVGKDGIGTDGIIEVDYKGVKAHKLWQVMEITTPYTEDLGYGIARVII